VASWMVSILALILAVLAIGSSPSFQSCLDQKQIKTGQQPFQNDIARIEATADNYRSCAGEFVEQHGEAVIAIFTVVLAISTILLWGVTRRSTKIAERALTVLERPYVVIDARTNRQEPTVDSTVEVRVVNHGRSTAFTGVVQGDWFLGDEPPKQFTPKGQHKSGVHWVIPPQSKGKVLHWPHGKNAAELAKVMSGETKLYFLAVISYRGGDRAWHTTGVCNVYDPPSTGLTAAGDAKHNFMT
jgi:hypothetical protein